MITDSFDDKSESKINPYLKDNAASVDACIVTFSHVIEKYVKDNYDLEQIGRSAAVTGDLPIYRLCRNGKKFAFIKTYAGAPACVATIEDTLSEIKTDKYIVFGGSGCLNKEIAHGKVMIPTEAYRDEGTSYHYAPASDYIAVKNAGIVAEFMKSNGIPFVKGKTWTTDSFYRETVNNFEKRKKDGCISVEMECSAIQAMCDFRNLNLYMFLTCGDLLDAPKHLYRSGDGKYKGTQHDAAHFEIALSLAEYVTKSENIDIAIEPLTAANIDEVRKIQRDDISTDFVDDTDTIMELTQYGIDHNCIGDTYAIKYKSEYIGVILLGEAIEWETDPPEMKETPFYRLMGFVLDKRYRGSGIGSYVLEKVIDTCYKKYGARPIALGCHKDNYRAAEFYLKHGFKKTEYTESEDYYYLRYPSNE